MGWYDRRTRRVRDLSCGDTRIYLEIEVRRVQCRSCGKVKRERLAFLADNPFYTKRFSHYVGRGCRSTTIKDLAKELHLDWDTVKTLEKQYMQAQLAEAGTPGPKAIGIDEISIRKGHTYRIVVSDLIRGRPIWFGGEDRSEKSMAMFYEQLGPKKSRGIRLAVMDMWKPFRNATNERASQAAILFDKFHITRHLGEALDKVRKPEYARLAGKDRSFIKGQKYTLLSHRENLNPAGRQNLRELLAANKRLNTAYLLKESFGQLWDYEREAWARRFFDNWRASLKWQRLPAYQKFAEMIDRHWDGIAAYCKPENNFLMSHLKRLSETLAKSIDFGALSQFPERPVVDPEAPAGIPYAVLVFSGSNRCRRLSRKTSRRASRRRSWSSKGWWPAWKAASSRSRTRWQPTSAVQRCCSIASLHCRRLSSRSGFSKRTP